jgi:hypothetical protein
MTIYHGVGGGGDATSDIELNALTTLTATATAAATAADASKTAAAASAASAASSYDSFDDRYLGSKTTDPTLDNDGNALLTGALYFNSTDNVMKVYTGAVWGAVSVPASGLLMAVDPNYTGTLTGGTGIVNIGSGQIYKDASGNVGIGTSSPNRSLVVNGAIKTQGWGGVNNGNLLFGADERVSIFGGGDTLVSFTAGTERMRIDANGNVGIGTSSPASSAILDAQSTTKGVRMPNMTTTQKNAISSPATGLMVFDTTLAKLCVYSGSAWQTVTST